MVLFPEDLEITVPDFFCFMWPLKEHKGLASSHQSNSTTVNKATEAGKEKVAKIALNWGSFFQKPCFLAFRGDLSSISLCLEEMFMWWTADNLQIVEVNLGLAISPLSVYTYCSPVINMCCINHG